MCVFDDMVVEFEAFEECHWQRTKKFGGEENIVHEENIET